GARFAGDSEAGKTRAPGWGPGRTSRRCPKNRRVVHIRPRACSTDVQENVHRSSPQGLLEDVELPVPFLVVLAKLGDPLDRVHHGGVVAPAEGLADLRE